MKSKNSRQRKPLRKKRDRGHEKGRRTRGGNDTIAHALILVLADAARALGDLTCGFNLNFHYEKSKSVKEFSIFADSLPNQIILPSQKTKSQKENVSSS